MKVELIDIRARMLTNSTTFELEQQQEQHHRLASSSASAWMREEDAAVDVGVSINNSPPPLYVTPIYDEERKAEDRIGHRHRRALFASSLSSSPDSRHRLEALLTIFLFILTFVCAFVFSLHNLAALLQHQGNANATNSFAATNTGKCGNWSSNWVAVLLRQDDRTGTLEPIGNALFVGHDRLVTLHMPPPQPNVFYIQTLRNRTYRVLPSAAQEQSKSTHYQFLIIDVDDDDEATNPSVCFSPGEETLDDLLLVDLEVAELYLESVVGAENMVSDPFGHERLADFTLVRNRSAAIGESCSTSVIVLVSTSVSVSPSANECIAWTAAYKDTSDDVESYLVKKMTRTEDDNKEEGKKKKWPPSYFVYERVQEPEHLDKVSMALRGAFVLQNNNQPTPLAYLQF